MFSKQRILGVSGSRINTQPSYSSSSLIATKSRSYSDGNPTNAATKIEAAMGSGTIGYSSASVGSFWASNYNYWFTGLIPADPFLIDTSTLALFYRRLRPACVN